VVRPVAVAASVIVSFGTICRTPGPDGAEVLSVPVAATIVVPLGAIPNAGDGAVDALPPLATLAGMAVCVDTALAHRAVATLLQRAIVGCLRLRRTRVGRRLA
jgi:hypothetical protein